jgi:hypothetical protein
MGHCDVIWNRTLRAIRELLPDIRIACWNVDSLWQPLNVARIQRRAPFADAIFITTAGEALKQFCNGRNVVA